LTETKSVSPLKLGVFVAALIWFLFSFHELFKAFVNINEYAFFVGPSSTWVLITDVSGVIGLVVRAIASLIAVVGLAFYLFKSPSKPSLLKILKTVLVLEAIYWLSLLISGIWGVLPSVIGGVGSSGDSGISFNLVFLVNTGIPCLVEAIALPIALIKLFFALNPNKPRSAVVKWGLITMAVYVIVFWLNNTCNWLTAALYHGSGIILDYPASIFSFALTAFGLLGLTLYALYFTKKSICTDSLGKIDWQKVGTIVVLLGLYFDIIYVMWLLLGSVGGWNEWYAWFLGHNMDLWLVALPIAGLPLLFKRKSNEK
jgi:hypothetical protein